MLKYKDIWALITSLLLLQNSTWANFQSAKEARQNALSIPQSKPASLGAEARQNLWEDCVMDTLEQFLSLEGLSVLLKVTSQQENVPPRVLLEALAGVHGLTVQEPGLEPFNRHFPPAFSDNDVINHKLEEESENFLNGVYHLLDLSSIPRTKMNSEVEVQTPDGLPRALLALLTTEGDVLSSRWINLNPRTSFVDFIKIPKEEDLSNAPQSSARFDFKLKRLRSRKCFALAVIGVLRASPSHPLLIQIFNSKLEVIWKDPCLPKVTDLLIYPGYVVTVSLTQ